MGLQAAMHPSMTARMTLHIASFDNFTVCDERRISALITFFSFRMRPAHEDLPRMAVGAGYAETVRGIKHLPRIGHVLFVLFL